MTVSECEHLVGGLMFGILIGMGIARAVCDAGLML
jgi:hypothetical protein